MWYYQSWLWYHGCDYDYHRWWLTIKIGEKSWLNPSFKSQLLLLRSLWVLKSHFWMVKYGQIHPISIWKTLWNPLKMRIFIPNQLFLLLHSLGHPWTAPQRPASCALVEWPGLHLRVGSSETHGLAGFRFVMGRMVKPWWRLGIPHDLRNYHRKTIL